jgi:hypothetical protein
MYWLTTLSHGEDSPITYSIRPSCLTAVDRLKFAPGGVCTDIQVGIFARHIDTVPEGADAPLAKLQQRNETRSD